MQRRSPWYERRPALLLTVLVVLYVAVLGARVGFGSGPHAVLVLYVFPVALTALRWGLRGGLAGAAVAVALMLPPELVGPSDLDAVGWGTRLSAIVLLGVLLGAAQDRTRAHEAWEREREAERLELRRLADRAIAATEINDTIVQGMATAKWMVEMGRADVGAGILGDTIDQAQQLVGELLGREVTNPVPPTSSVA